MNDSEQSFVSSVLMSLDARAVREASACAELLCQRLRNLSQTDILTDWRICLAGNVTTDPHQWALASLNHKGQIAWERGRQEIWFAQQLTMPAAIGGYPVTSRSCRLAFTWWAEVAQVFVDGELVQEGDLFDHSPRVLLMPAVVPGTPVDVRLRLVSPGHDIGALMRSRLIYESADPLDPEPGWLADELAVIVKQVASFQPAKLAELVKIIDTIDYDLLKVDSHQFIAHVLAVKQQIKSIFDFGGDLPTPPVGHPSREGIFSVGLGGVKTIQLLGHAHLDMAWLWEVAET